MGQQISASEFKRANLLTPSEIVIADKAIVIVDDMRFSRAFMRSALEQHGYKDLRATDSANHALDLLRERRADAILVNWVMPEMTGIELVSLIRQHDEDSNHYTGVILFTAKEGVAPLVEAFQQGVDDYVRIPVDNEELAGRVYSALRLANIQNNLLRKSQALAAHQQKELITLNLIDSVTGLGNDRYLYNRLDSVFDEIQEHEGGACLALVSLAETLQIFEAGGRKQLNRLLEKVGQRLKASVRPSDVVAHLGDGQFAIVLHRPQPEPFDYAVFERITQSIAANPIPLGDDEPELKVTPRLGGCHYNATAGMSSRDAMLRCANEKLRQADAEGLQIVLKVLEPG